VITIQDCDFHSGDHFESHLFFFFWVVNTQLKHWTKRVVSTQLIMIFSGSGCMYSHVHKYVYMDGCLDLISFFYVGFL